MIKRLTILILCANVMHWAFGCGNIVVGENSAANDTDSDRSGGSSDAIGSGSDGDADTITNTDADCDTSELLAFPCAEGYGKYATGGRGGEVYEVTNLDASGAGSLGDALSESGRTVVFRVAGTIVGRFNVPNNTTIAGQTAPGDGIAVHGTLKLGSNIIVRYIRVRHDGNDDSDAIEARYQNNIILDHVSASWGSDEVMTLYWNQNTTIQWSMVTEACPSSDNDTQRFGGIWGGENNTYHHNLIAHNGTNNPRWASGCGHNDYRNNVLYNWGYNSCKGGERDEGDGEHIGTWINMIANYYKPGPGTESGVRDLLAAPSSRDGESDFGSWYLSGNVMEDNESVTSDNWNGVSGSDFIAMDSPWDAMPINEQSAEGAFLAVLADVGCTKPRRDALDTRIIGEVRDGTATVGENGLVNCPEDTLLPTLNSADPRDDSDHDGMPDEWEAEHGLNPNDASDRNRTWGPGYTMLEMYLNRIDNF